MFGQREKSLSASNGCLLLKCWDLTISKLQAYNASIQLARLVTVADHFVHRSQLARVWYALRNYVECDSPKTIAKLPTLRFGRAIRAGIRRLFPNIK